MENMQNRPWKVIDPETGEEKIIWESRSCASVVFVFTKDKNKCWRVLANVRGEGCPDFNGYWCCPCGYLDYNETTRDAAVRECREETGIRLNGLKPRLFKVNDKPSENRQNVAFVYYTEMKHGCEKLFSKAENEANEVDDINWIPVDEIQNYKWAFGHYDIITEVFNKRINISWWKKVILKLYDKYLAPED